VTLITRNKRVLADDGVGNPTLGLSENRMFSRFAFSICALLALMYSNSAIAGSLSNLLGWHSSSDVATQVSEFNENSPVGGLAFNADGSRIAVNPTFADLDVHIWDWAKRKRLDMAFHNVGPPLEGKAIQYSVDGSLLAVGHERASQQNGFEVIRIWNASGATARYSINEPSGGSSKGIAFTADGKFFIRTISRPGSPGDNITVHGVPDWSVAWGLRTVPLIPRSLAVSADSRFAAIGGEKYSVDGRMRIQPQIAIVDLSAHQIVRTIDDAFPDHNQVLTLAFSPDGKSLAAGAIVGGTSPGPDAVKIFDSTSGTMIAGEPAQGAAYVNGLAYSADGQYLIEGYIDGHVRIWDSQHRKLLQTIAVDDHFHTVLTVSRDSRYLAIGSGKVVLVYQLK
jgi:WD40 repeat protein